MGLFSKLKSVFSKQEEVKESLDNNEIKVTKEQKEELKETEKYVDGLSKSRDNFVNKLSILGIKYTKISEDFYDELEEILITADIGVNTVMDFVNRLRKRVKEEHIEDFEYTFKKGFWYPFDQNEYGVELHSGDECEVTESFSYEGAEEYFEKW